MRFSIIVFVVSMVFSGFAQPGEVNKLDAKGLKQGKWQKTFDGSRVFQYKGQFKNDKPVGKFTYFYESSKVKAVIIHDENSNRSTAYYFHENGALMSNGIFRDQKKDSVWVNFGPSERLSNKETYRNGLLNGKKIIYYVPEDINDKSQIPAAVYTYKDGVLNGDFKEYFENLSVKTKGQYENNKKVGIWERYHPNGKKMTLTRYRLGHRHGWCMAYDATGKETGKEYYYYGRLLEGEELKAKMEKLKELGVDPNK